MSEQPQAPQPPARKRWFTRLAAVGFWLFLLKGLAWLLVPLALGWFGGDGG